MEERKVKKLVVVLKSVDTNEVLERWEFKIEYDDKNVSGRPESNQYMATLLRD